MNLLEETLEAISESGHSIGNVAFIGSQETGHSCGWVEFTGLADKEYDKIPGVFFVAPDLTVVFTCGESLRRKENPDPEGWEVSPYAVTSTEEKYVISSLFTSDSGWKSLQDINGRVDIVNPLKAEYIPDEYEISNLNLEYTPEGVEEHLKSDPFNAKCTHMGLNFVGYIMWDSVSEDYINEVWLMDDIDLPKEQGRPMPYAIERADSFENVVKRTNNEFGWE